MRTVPGTVPPYGGDGSPSCIVPNRLSRWGRFDLTEIQSEVRRTVPNHPCPGTVPGTILDGGGEDGSKCLILRLTASRPRR
jgi:hypothetical protein